MTSENHTPTGAQVRGAIQGGATGDIRPGFDPAAAPYETDAEAGGESSAPAIVDALPASEDSGEKSYDVAMRAPGTGNTTSQTGRTAPHAIIVVVLVVIAVALCVLSWLGNF